VRACGLAVVLVGLAWPCAVFLGQPILFPLIAATAANVVIRALASPALLLWARHLEQGKLVRLELAAEVVRVIATVASTLALRSVWGLVIGGLIGELTRMAGSYLLDAVRPRWCWQRVALRELLRYGRFIFANSVLGLLASRLDVLFVAKCLGMERAGVYYIATAIIGLLDGLFAQLSAGILFPALSRRQENHAVLMRRTTDVACLVLLVAGAVAAVAIANASTILHVLYDERYADAAIALRWLCAAACVRFLAATLNAPLMATAHHYWGVLATVGKLSTFVAVALPLGARWGISGYAIAVAGSCLSALAITVFAVLRYGFLSLPQFLRALGGLGAFVMAVGLGFLAADRFASGLTGTVVLLVGTTLLLVAFWAGHRRQLMALVSR
jgi:O-antigen/teichoic acid export membrane protein